MSSYVRPKDVEAETAQASLISCALCQQKDFNLVALYSLKTSQTMATTKLSRIIRLIKVAAKKIVKPTKSNSSTSLNSPKVFMTEYMNAFNHYLSYSDYQSAGSALFMEQNASVKPMILNTRTTMNGPSSHIAYLIICIKKAVVLLTLRKSKILTHTASPVTACTHQKEETCGCVVSVVNVIGTVLSTSSVSFPSKSLQQISLSSGYATSYRISTYQHWIRIKMFGIKSKILSKEQM